MKGVILGICPQAQIVDISHDVTPFEIAEGAYLIAQAYRYFPAQDGARGGGGPRRGHGAAAHSGGGRAASISWRPITACCPWSTSREKHKIRLISNERYFRHPVSRTFHGRDIFAPVARAPGRGRAAGALGQTDRDYLRPAFEKPQRTGKRTWTGQILHIDRFGNIVTNFHADDFPDLETRNFTLAMGPQAVTVLARNYAECGAGELFLILGSSGYYEVSLSQGSAARLVKCEPGAAIELMVW